MPGSSNKLNRRRFLERFALTGIMFPFVRRAEAMFSRYNLKRQLLYIGTYTTGTASEGIYIHYLDTKTGTLTPYKVVGGVTDPSFLAIDRPSHLLFAVNETLEYNDMKSGSVSSFSIDQQTGELKFLNKQASMGGAPCHISISRNGSFVLVANYVGGNVSVLPIDKIGKLQSAVEVKQHEGVGPNKERQESAHAHWVDFDNRGRIVAACDLGADKIFLYRFDEHSGKLIPNTAQPFFQTKPGAGPRHLTFHPNGKFAFVINELNSSITALAYDQHLGKLDEIQLSPNGNFLYGSNRGHDSIASYHVDETTGKLSLIEHVSTGGKAPRNFVIDPTGAILLAANQKSDSVVSFAVDRNTGSLHPTGNKYAVPSPVCLKLIPAVE
jgi:6-phosphogluconolactonase